MQVEELIRLMQQNQEPTHETLVKLDSVLAQFPWFSIGHQLKLKALLAADAQKFEQYLSFTAAYTLSREQLYNFLYHPSPYADDGNEIELIPTSAADEPAEDDPASFLPPPPIFTSEPTDYFSLEQIDNEKSSQPMSDSDLLDRFIAANPKISPRLTSSTEGQEVVLSDSTEDIASETLAKVYADQGFVAKAITVYQKLSLQNPEKKAYFATLIEELEGKK